MTITSRMVGIGLRSVPVATLLAVLWGAASISSQSNARWITAWSTSQQTLGEDRITNATLRHDCEGDDPRRRRSRPPRQRLRNRTSGIGRAFVGQRVRGAALAAGSNRPLTFGGASETTLPPGGNTVWSDPVSITVHARQDLAISLHVRGAGVRPSQHTNAAGRLTGPPMAPATMAEEGAMKFETTTTALWWLKAIDVQSASHRHHRGLWRFNH